VKSYSIFALIQGLVLGLLVLWLWAENRPVGLPDAPLPADGRMQCVSYAPYYKAGETPFDETAVTDPARIEADLRLLSERFACVRTYTVGQGLDVVPEIAEKLGLKVLLGIWIGSDAVRNEREIARAVEIARRHAPALRAVIVGNEVLLRREQNLEAMRALVSRVKAQISVPVSYADVWEFWLKNKSLAADVDFAIVHILPYWEDEPQAIGDAVRHVDSVLERCRTELQKPLLIGETGWPSRGKQREGAVPGLVNEARYFREFLASADTKGWQYNLIEAFDQPWKRLLEGTVGGFWGIYADDLTAKFPLKGPVAERRDGVTLPLGALAGLVLAVSLGVATGIRGAGLRRPGGVLGLGAFGAAYGLLIPLQLEYLQSACRNLIEYASMGGMAAAGLVLALAVPFLAAGRLRESRVAGGACRLLLFGAAVSALLLAVDARYRDFPLFLFLMPAIQLALALPATGFRWQSPQRERVLGPVLAVAGLAAWGADYGNPHAALWGLTCLLLAYSAIRPRSVPTAA